MIQPREQDVGAITVIVGGSRAARDAALGERLDARVGMPIREVRCEAWPFLRSLDELAPSSGSVTFVARHLARAFPDAQTAGTRLVLTQSTYQLQRWLDWIAARQTVTLLCETSEADLRRHAPEAFARRGPWSRIECVELPSRPADARHAETGDAQGDQRDDLSGRLAAAFAVADPDERLARCRREADARPDDPMVLLALGSALMEVQDVEAAQRAVERAVALSPDWEAAHYELGKVHLRRDDLESASRAFADAGRLMPTFAAAFSNLGATLGELDRRDEALVALRQALRHDPNGYTIVNNLGVVSRELGRLSESEAAFRRVVALAPEFVFGHYNLGHTLFLQGRYQAAVAAYAEGQRRDPERNARQACRLAIARLAAGDPEGSVRDLGRAVQGLPSGQKREILGEAQEILWALLADRPALTGWKRVADAVTLELGAR